MRKKIQHGAFPVILMGNIPGKKGLMSWVFDRHRKIGTLLSINI